MAFQPGQSGNPKGRPSGTTKRRSALIDFLDVTARATADAALAQQITQLSATYNRPEVLKSLSETDVERSIEQHRAMLRDAERNHLEGVRDCINELRRRFCVEHDISDEEFATDAIQVRFVMTHPVVKE